MKASNIFKYLVRILFISFLATFSIISFKSNSSIEQTNQKLKSLGGKNNRFSSANSQWKELDKRKAHKKIKQAIKQFENGDFKEYENSIYIAKLLAADLQESPIFIKINKTENAIQNALTLKNKFKNKDQVNSDLVQVTSNYGNPLITGYILKKSKSSMLIQDLDGFQTTVLIKNSTITKLDAKEKVKHYRAMFETIKIDNGITNSYGLYQSAHWAYKHKLEKDVNKILLKASLNDSKIIATIFDEDAKKVLRVAVWSKIIGNYKVASLNANLILKDYNTSAYVKEAQEVLDEISAIKVKHLAKIEQKRRKALAQAEARIKRQELEESNRKEKAPVVADKSDNMPPVDTLVFVSAIAEPANEIKNDESELVLVTVEKGKTKELPEEERPLPEETEQFEDGIFANATFKRAQKHVKEAKAIMRKAMSYQNPGHKKAQSNFLKAKKAYQKASKLLNKLARKYNGNDDFEDLAGQANGGIFFLNKSCIRHY